MPVLFTIGLNHRTAPVEVRERLAIPPDRLPEALDVLSQRLPDAQMVVVSTCNRVEIYLSCDDEDAAERAIRFMEDAGGAEPGSLREFTYVHRDDAAIRHLFAVASGMDSMVVGETQINSQIKQAYMVAAEHGATGKVLNTLFQRAFAVAKEVYRKTGITDRKVSVSSVAADLAARIFETFDGKTVMIVGAGETGELALRHILESGKPQVVVANRTIERARALAEQFQGKAISLDDLPRRLAGTDVVICCTASPQPVLTRDTVAQATRGGRGAPMFIVDIAVPRDVEPAVGELDNVYLYNIDDIEQIVRENMEQRRQELERCAKIVDHEVAEFVEWMRMDRAAPTIQALMGAMNQMKAGELERLRRKLGRVSDADWRHIEQMAGRLVSKVAHHPTVTLREEAKKGEHWYTQAVHKLFGLAGGEEEGPS